MISENNLLPLNDTEHFLKNFLKKFPVYQTKIINPLANELQDSSAILIPPYGMNARFRIRLFFSPVHPDIFLKIFLSRKIKMSVF